MPPLSPEHRARHGLQRLLRETSVDQSWVVPGAIPLGRTLIYGPPKAGKSMLLLGLADALHHGTSWIGFPATAPMGVVYVSVDSTNADVALQAGGPYPPPNLPGMQLTSDFAVLSYTYPEADPSWVPQYFLDKPTGRLRVAQLIRAMDPDVILYDGLTYCSATADFNSGQAVKLTYAALDAVSGGRPYVLLGHDNKEQNEETRSAVARMKGAVEWVAGVSAYYHLVSEPGTRAGTLEPGGRNIAPDPIPLDRLPDGRWARRAPRASRARVLG